MNVAGADIDGNAMADNIIVGPGPGIDSQVKVFSSELSAEKDDPGAEAGSHASAGADGADACPHALAMRSPAKIQVEQRQ